MVSWRDEAHIDALRFVLDLHSADVCRGRGLPGGRPTRLDDQHLGTGEQFLVDQQCGRKDATLFTKVMKSVAADVRRTQDTTFLSDGERRYGNALFELCAQTTRTGQRGRPRRTLPKGGRVRIKNKGGQRGIGAVPTA